MLIGFILFLIGLILTFVGILLIGAQVNKHQIRPGSAAAWVFRVGALAVLIGAALAAEPTVIQVSRLIGAAIMATSVIMLNHEWVQAGHIHDPAYRFKPTPDMLGFFFVSLLSAVILIVSLAQNTSWATFFSGLVVVVLLVFGVRMYRSNARAEAHFKLARSLTLQVCGLGMALTVLGTILAARI